MQPAAIDLKGGRSFCQAHVTAQLMGQLEVVILRINLALDTHLEQSVIQLKASTMAGKLVNAVLADLGRRNCPENAGMRADLTAVWCSGMAPGQKQSPTSYARPEQEMQPRKLSNV